MIRPEINLYEQAGRPCGTPPEAVEKVASPHFRVRLHDGRDSFSGEKVVPSVMSGVISDVHAAGNVGFDSCGCGRRNSLQECFFDKLRLGAPAAPSLNFFISSKKQLTK